MNKNKSNKRLQLFDITKDGRGIGKKEDINPSGLKRFFTTYRDNLGKLLSVNIIFVLGNFPLFFLIAVLSGYTRVAAFLPASDLYQNLGGIFMIEEASPATMTLYSLLGLQNQILINTPLTYIFLGISALFLFTFGPVNVGTAYVLRNLAKGEPVFVFSDFIYAVKRNIKQALPFGIIDGLINALLIFNVYTTMSSANFITSMMFWANIILIVLYFFMRCYIYVQMVTFKLSVFKILKNSLIFALLGLKRNFIALIGSAILIVLEVSFVFSVGGILLPLGVGLPLLLLFSSMAYMKVFASYFKIKEIMIDPYIEENSDEIDDSSDDDIIMHDDVTERERLEEIKRRNGLV